MTATAAQFGLSAIGQIFIRARDLDRAVRFYRGTLGMPFLFQAPPQMAFFQCGGDRKSTRLNSSHSQISYAVFCLKKNNELLKVKELVDLHPLFGEYDLIAKIAAEDFTVPGRVVVDRIRSLPGVVATTTLTGIQC